MPLNETVVCIGLITLLSQEALYNEFILPNLRTCSVLDCTQQPNTGHVHIHCWHFLANLGRTYDIMIEPKPALVTRHAI